jgi:hypothetical protein
MTPLDQIKYAAIAVLASLALIFYNLYLGAKDELSNYRAAVESEMEAVRLENAERLRAMAETAHHAAEGWESARAALADRPRIRVQHNCSQGGLSTNATAAPGLNATTEALTLSSDQCAAYLEDGISDAAQLAHLQQFLLDQHEASK